jgi:hypothetical protein
MKSNNTSFVNNNTMIYLKSILEIFFHNLVSAQKFSNLISFIFLVFNCCGIKAQEKIALPTDTFQMRSMATDGFTPGLPKVALPTPNSSALTRYGDYPVDYRTGLIETKIPIYEVQSGSIKLPINIQYHASGRLANEVNGIFGMRWTIESGGVITRTMKGRPDEWESLVSYNIDPNSIPSYDVLQRSVTDGYVNRPDSQNIRYDSEFDVFRFVLPSGKQGKFILKKENGVFQAITLPYNAFKIQVFQDINYYGYFSAIQLTEADGTIHIFGNKANVDASFIEYTENPHEGVLGSIPSAWYLKEIISSNRKYNISLEYRVNQTLTSNYQETVTTGDKIRDESDVFNPHPNDYVAPSVTTMLGESYKEEDINNQYKTIYPLVVSKINFDGGSVEFNYMNKQGLDNYNLFLDHISIPAINRTINFTTERNPNEN